MHRINPVDVGVWGGPEAGSVASAHRRPADEGYDAFTGAPRYRRSEVRMQNVPKATHLYAGHAGVVESRLARLQLAHKLAASFRLGAEGDGWDPDAPIATRSRVDQVGAEDGAGLFGPGCDDPPRQSHRCEHPFRFIVPFAVRHSLRLNPTNAPPCKRRAH